MRKYILIEAPSNLGLKEPFPGIEPGVKLFPSAMEAAGFASKAGIAEKNTRGVSLLFNGY
jgi:arginase